MTEYFKMSFVLSLEECSQKKEVSTVAEELFEKVIGKCLMSDEILVPQVYFSGKKVLMKQ